MEQRTVIRFLTPKGLKAKDLQTELEREYDHGALEIDAIKMARPFLAEANRPLRSPKVLKTTKPGLSDVINKILKEWPFLFCKVS
jgi:hypothetical protein